MNVQSNADDAIVYFETAANLTTLELEGFFVGWPNPPSTSMLLKVLKNSEHCVIAFDKKEHRVVGFINCISDGLLSAYIPLLEVLPEYQHQGIATKLMEQMLEMASDYYMIDLSCDDSIVPFYEKLGMRKGIAMSRRNYDRQSGAHTLQT